VPVTKANLELKQCLHYAIVMIVHSIPPIAVAQLCKGRSLRLPLTLG
jgi:hypothetical protein